VEQVSLTRLSTFSERKRATPMRAAKIKLRNICAMSARNRPRPESPDRDKASPGYDLMDDG
jgi:hypothetical protein